MTAAFDTFMTQHNKTGSEKADGYSNDAFIGLTEHESEIVFSLLEAELPFSAEWIFLVDKERAIKVVGEMEKRMRRSRHEHVYLLQEYLVKYSGDLEFQMHAIEDYPNYIDGLKPLVIDSIGRTSINDASISFLKQVLVTETNSSAVSRAARRLLSGLKIARSTDDDENVYQQLVRELTAESVQVRLRALAKIDMIRDMPGLRIVPPKLDS